METLNISFEQVEKVYVGKNHCYRCGCRGKYWYPTHTDQQKSCGYVVEEQYSDKKVKSLITRANTLLNTGEGKLEERNDNWVQVSYGNDRAITIYLKKSQSFMSKGFCTPETTKRNFEVL